MENASLFEKLKPHIMAIQLICNEEHITEDDMLSITVCDNYFDVVQGDYSITHCGDVWDQVRHHKHGDNHDTYSDVREMMEG